MLTAGLVVVAIAVLPAFGLALLGWLAIATETDDAAPFAGMGGISFEDV